MLLCCALDLYFSANLRIQSRHTERQYLFALSSFRDAIGHEPTLEDLSDDNVRRMMRLLLQRGRSAVTINDRRIQICALWTWCCKRNMVSVWPTVDPLPVARKIPRAWTPEQLKQLLRACRESTGKIHGIPARDWWTALHCVLWDCGSRIGETLQFRWEWYDENSATIYAPAHIRKGKRKEAIYTLHDDTRFVLATIHQTHSPLIFPSGHITSFYQRYTRLLKRAGLPHDRYSKPQKMRRSHASWLKAAGGDATLSLGHESDATTRVSYLDPTVTGESPAQKLFRLL